MKKIFIPFILLLLCGGIMVNYLKNEKHSKSPIDKKIVQLAFLTDANSLDPRYGYEVPANSVVKMLFDGLMRYDIHGNIAPSVAYAVDISEDQKTYIFHLRDSFWTNGQPVTSHDFAYAWKEVINPQSASKGASDFYPIKNVEAVLNGNASIEQVGIRVLDDKTLQIELEYPAPYFLELTTTSAYSPIYSKADLNDPQWADSASTFISNGPFVLKEWRKGYELKMEKNHHYWDANHVFLDGIQAAIVEDLSTQLSLFEQKKLDWLGKPLSKLPLDAVPTLREKQLLELNPELAVYWYWINTEAFPFNNNKIRKAFAYAINRKEMTDHLLQENETPALGITSDFAYFMDGDVALAQQLFSEGLQEIGITIDEFPIIPLSYCGIEVNQRIAQVVQQQWQHALGVTVKLLPQEWTTYYDHLSHGRFMIGGMSWHSRINDPIYNLQIFTLRSNGLNMTGWEDPSFQASLKRATHEGDPRVRSEVLHDAEKILMDHMPVIPIYFLTIGYAKSDGLQNVYVSKLNQIDFKWASFSSDQP